MVEDLGFGIFNVVFRAYGSGFRMVEDLGFGIFNVGFTA